MLKKMRDRPGGGVAVCFNHNTLEEGDLCEFEAIVSLGSSEF